MLDRCLHSMSMLLLGRLYQRGAVCCAKQRDSVGMAGVPWQSHVDQISGQIPQVSQRSTAGGRWLLRLVVPLDTVAQTVKNFKNASHP